MIMKRKDAQELFMRYKLELMKNKQLGLDDIRSWKSYDKIRKELECRIDKLEMALGVRNE